jgi:hypothetical protein
MKNVKKTIGFDRMSLNAKLPSGASLKFSIGRSGEKLELAFSNDIKILKEQMIKMTNWIKTRPTETNIQRFERLENLLNSCNTSVEVMDKIEQNIF